MCFGDIDGITLLHPEQIVDNPHAPLVVITQPYLFNRRVLSSDDTGVLGTDISGIKSTTLSSKQFMSLLDFVVSSYTSGGHNIFVCMLRGFDKERYYSNSLCTVFRSDLPAGIYHFLMKAVNSDGRWNEAPIESEIVVFLV